MIFVKKFYQFLVENLMFFAVKCDDFCNVAFTHSCSCLALVLAVTFVCLCLCTNALLSHAYEHSHVRTHLMGMNRSRHLSPLTRVGKLSQEQAP